MADKIMATVGAMKMKQQIEGGCILYFSDHCVVQFMGHTPGVQIILSFACLELVSKSYRIEVIKSYYALRFFNIPGIGSHPENIVDLKKIDQCAIMMLWSCIRKSLFPRFSELAEILF